MACAPDGTVTSGLIDSFPAMQEHDDWTCIIVRAVLHDEGLMYFDTQYETTTYPCELLWGPGTWPDALSWLEKEQPTDEVKSWTGSS